MTKALKRLLASVTGRDAFFAEMAIVGFSEHVAKLLDANEMTQRELAATLKLSEGRIAQIMSGESNLTLATMAKVLSAFDHVIEIDSRSVFEEKTEPICKLAGGEWYRVDNVPKSRAWAALKLDSNDPNKSLAG